MVYRVQNISLHSVRMFDWPARPKYVHELTLGWIKFNISCFFSTPGDYLNHLGEYLQPNCPWTVKYTAVSFANRRTLYCILSGRLLISSRKNIGPKTNPCGTPDETEEKRRKRTNIRNRYNHAPHLTQDTNGKETTSQLDTTNESQEGSPFPAGDHKASTNRRAWKHNKASQK